MQMASLLSQLFIQRGILRGNISILSNIFKRVRSEICGLRKVASGLIILKHACIMCRKRLLSVYPYRIIIYYILDFCPFRVPDLVKITCDQRFLKYM